MAFVSVAMGVWSPTRSIFPRILMAIYVSGKVITKRRVGDAVVIVSVVRSVIRPHFAKRVNLDTGIKLGIRGFMVWRGGDERWIPLLVFHETRFAR